MTGQPSLFSRSGDVPLAERLRPKTLADYIGQKHILGPGMPLTVAITQQKPFSMLLWGAPGCGKTTLALLLADRFAARFIRLSAVFSGVKEVREAVLEAQQERSLGRKTILFIDEIHRFNKAQQDAFLPYVEDGSLILIGATTENPAFHLNNALLSRLRVFHLQPLSEDELIEKLRRGVAALNLDDTADSVLATIAYQSGATRAKPSAGSKNGRCCAARAQATKTPSRKPLPTSRKRWTNRATGSTNSFPPSTNPCAARIRTAPCTGSRAWWTAAPTR